MAKKKEVKKKVEKIEKVVETKEKYNFWDENKGIIITLAIIVGAIIIGLLVYKYNTSFTFNGVDFEKRYYGELLFYTAKIPVEDYYGNIIEYRLLDFRNDPRKLDKMVEIPEDLQITFRDDYMTYLSFLEDTLKCENNGLASANFAIFLRDVIKVEYKPALANETEAIQKNLTHVTCENSPFNTVIYIHQGDETKITKRIASCYDVEFKNCEILEALERFELKILEQYMQGLN
ncbi:MAG: hypothetical protein Q8L27_02135 [archaeon]|nr:hypothetical protein [archaeon]